MTNSQDPDRQRRYLESFLASRKGSEVQGLVPIVSRWHSLLATIPALAKRNPGRHCRVSNLRDGVLTVEADHPGWLQLLQWNQLEILNAVIQNFPELKILALQFRLIRAGEGIERPTVIAPEPQKPELSTEEQRQLDEILSELEAMIRKNT